MHESGYALAMIAMIAIFCGVMYFAFGGKSSRYPDGRCYLCRKGAVFPGETCKRCGAEQP